MDYEIHEELLDEVQAARKDWLMYCRSGNNFSKD
jgi:hypothetical protein